MKFIFISAMLLVLFYQCNSPADPAKPATDTAENDNEATGLINDTVTITGKSAVLYVPDSALLEKRIQDAAAEEEAFTTGMDDYLYYLHEADAFLEETKLPVVYTDGKPYVKFSGSNGVITLIKTDTLPALWGIYFFDPAKQPQSVDITIIEEEYKNYFKE